MPKKTKPVAEESDDLAPLVGHNLRRLRTKRGLSLEALAERSGVSRAMLGQIELGQSAPTINSLWKIARGLGVTFSALMTRRPQHGPQLLSKADAKQLVSKDGSFSSRALFPFDAPRRVEFYELRLAGRGQENAEAHTPGTTENLVVAKGRLELEIGGATYELRAQDAIYFEADVAHVYRNPDPTEAILYLVMTYAEEIG